ncbi:MAG: hypothetical protein RLZZ381_134 [Cyanobacteriota bacterium]|jgi:CheY-like chemotaxis protein
MNQQSILLIEDSKGIQAVTKFSLEMDDVWQVKVANCGTEGLLKAKTINPDVILLDLILPDMSGVEILEQLQLDDITKSIPVIIFTTELIEAEKLELNHSNVIGLIIKPFDCLTLSTRIADILEQ